MKESDKLATIKELMDQLQSEMDSSPDDFNERLGRKPKVEAIAIKVEEKPKFDMKNIEEPFQRLQRDEPKATDKNSLAQGMDSEESEMEDPEMDSEESLKERLMKLRSNK